MKRGLCGILSLLVCTLLSVQMLPAEAQQPEKPVLVLPVLHQNGGLLVEDGIVPMEASGSELRRAAELPAAFDLRDVDGRSYITSVKNQQDNGLCWAFSALGAMESNILMQGLEMPAACISPKGEIDLSEAALAWYPFTNHMLPGDFTSGDYVSLDNKGTSGGNATIAGYGMAALGVNGENSVPLSAWDSGYSEYTRFSSLFRLTESRVIQTLEEGDEDRVKSWLMQDGAVSVSFYSKAAFYENDFSYAYYQVRRGNSAADHSVLIVGWDDTYSRENFDPANPPSRDGAWICRNSWGTKDPYEGYFYMSYDEPSLCEFSSFIAEPAQNEMLYQYDGASAYACLAYPAAANVFTAQENGLIEDIVFPVCNKISAPVECTVYVYRLHEKPADPTDGTLIARRSGVFDTHGYKRLSLRDLGAQVRQGEKFSVMLTVRNTESGAADYIAMESEKTGSGILERYRTILPGQSFVQGASGSWADVVDLKTLVEENVSDFAALGNIALKAVVRPVDETLRWTQLREAVSRAEQSGLSLGAPLEAAQAVLADENAAQVQIDYAAQNLLAALEQNGVLDFDTLYRANIPFSYGDVVQDQVLDTKDAEAVLYLFSASGSGALPALYPAQILAADVNEDGATATEDAYRILYYFAVRGSSGATDWDQIRKGALPQK